MGLSVSPLWSQYPAELGSCAEEDCHAEVTTAFESNPHVLLDTKGIAKRASADFSCAACHGDVSVHTEDEGGPGNIFAFKSLDAAKLKSQPCQTCHAANHPAFAASPHARGTISCSTCHTIHGSDSAAQGMTTALLVRPKSELCSKCHSIVAAEFTLNEGHRLDEDLLSCVTCHDPHEPQTRGWLGGFKQATCLKCHTDKQGPFLFEHGGIRIEGCTACHDPHGSPNRHLLTFQRVEDQCLSCHATLPIFHLRLRGNETQCTNCHASIHGSNLSPYLLK